MDGRWESWTSHSVPPGAKDSCICKAAVQLAQDTALTQVVDQPTRGNNILDLLLTNRPSLVNRLASLPPLSAKADHNCVLLSINTKAFIAKKAQRTIHNYNRADWESIKQNFGLFSNEFKSTTFSNIQDMWNSFETKVHNLITKHVPSKTISGSKLAPKPWITSEIRHLLKKRDTLHGVWLKTKQETNLTSYLEYKSKAQRLIRQEHWKYTESLLNIEQTSVDNPRQKPDTSKKFWSYIKSKRKDFCSVPPLKKEGVLISDSKGKADILNEQYSSVFTTSNLPLPNVGSSPFPKSPAITITTSGVEKLLANLNPNKASGPDNIPTRFLRELSSEVAPVLSTIFRFSLITGKVPSQWRDANVTPVFKKGDKSLASNYRPISLTSVCSKLCEHIIAKSIMTHLELNNILSDFQHGFRAKRSCETQLITFWDEIVKNSNSGGQTDVIIMDFSKAFDVVPHNLLFLKLRYLGISDCALDWTKDFLANRRQRVVVDGEFSTHASVSSGVPQGSVLGPILFLCYINDLPSSVSSNVRLFADDSIMYKKIKSQTDCQSLQCDLTKLESWEKTWGMCFHQDKCNIIRMTRKKQPILHNYTLKGHPLATVNQAKYLGVTLSGNLTWNNHINSIANKGNRTLGFVRRNIRTSSLKAKSLAYTSLVRPQLEYCSTVWDPHQLTLKCQLEATQRRAARYACHNFHQTASVTEMITKLKWQTLENRRKFQKLTMFYKIINSIVAINILNHASKSTRPTRSNQTNNFIPISTRTSYHKASFFPSTIPMWNSLAESVKTSTSVAQFRTGLYNSYQLNSQLSKL